MFLAVRDAACWEACPFRYCGFPELVQVLAFSAEPVKETRQTYLYAQVKKEKEKKNRTASGMFKHREQALGCEPEAQVKPSPICNPALSEFMTIAPAVHSPLSQGLVLQDQTFGSLL